MPEEQKTLKEIAEEEEKSFQEEAKKYREEKGYKDFLSLPRGETQIEVLDVPPRDWVQDGKAKKIFRVRVNGKEFDWCLNKQNPVYRDVIHSLADGKQSFFILRSGSGTETRYEFVSFAEKEEAQK